MARVPLAGLFFAAVSAAFALLIILSGIAGQAPFFFLQINTSGLHVPSGGSQLSHSQILQDLSSISTKDWVGSGNGQTIEVADTYRLTLLTVCQTNNGQSSCGKFRFGLNFDPEETFQLDSSTVQTSFSSADSAQIKAYNNISMFLAVGYVLGVGLTGLSIIFMLLTARVPKGASLAAFVVQSFAALLLFATSIGAAVTFYRLGDTFNAMLGSLGIQTTVSWRIMIISFTSALEAFVVLLFLWGYRKGLKRLAQSPRMIPPMHNGTKGLVTGSADGSYTVAVSSNQPALRGIPKPGFLNKIPTWRRNQRYTEVGKPHGDTISLVPGHMSDKKSLIEAHEEDDFSHGMPDDIAQGAMGYNPRDPTARYDDPTAAEPRKSGVHADTAYDPYRK